MPRHLSVFQPTNKMASERRLEANNRSRSNRKDPAVFCEDLPEKTLNRTYPTGMVAEGCLINTADAAEHTPDIPQCNPVKHMRKMQPNVQCDLTAKNDASNHRGGRSRSGKSVESMCFITQMHLTE